MAWKLTIGGAITSNSVANPTVVTTPLAHGLTSGDTVIITGVTGSTPSINSSYTATVTGTNTFTVPVNVTVGGTGGAYAVDRVATQQIDAYRGCSISMPLNERATMRFSLINGVLPPKRADVVAYAQDGTTRLFAGVIVQRRMVSYEGRSLAAFVDCDCGDYSTYADWCFQTKSYPAGDTLENILDDLVADKLGAYGVTVHPSQVTGPTLVAFEWVDKRVSDCLRELSDRTGYVYRIDADKQLRMFVPGTDAAPFTVTAGTPNVENIEWTDSGEVPANTVTVRCGPDGVDEVTQTWIQAGGATSWVTDIPAAGPTAGYVTVNGIARTVGEGASYEWDADTSTLSLGTDSVPTNGWTIVLTYLARFPFTVTATTGGSPVVEAIYSYPDVKVYATAVELAAGLLDRQAQEPRILTMPSTQIGWLPGQAVSVVHANRDINDADATISNVEINLISDAFWRYMLTVQETTAPQGSYLQEWRDMLGHGGGSGAAPGTTVIDTLAHPAGGDTQVQFNDGGSFGADATFTFTKSTDTLGVNNVVSQSGTDLTITGAAGSGASGRGVTITGGATDMGGGTGGPVTIAGGSITGGASATYAGSVVIKSGNTQYSAGTVTITTGTFPASYASPGTLITVKPATPTTSGDSTSAPGGGILIEGGPGQANDSGGLSNGTAGAGGPVAVKAGYGGDVAGSSNTRTAGAGATLTLAGGDGGDATGSGGGTLTGGNGGPVVVQSGAGGTGEDTNGTDGTITLKTGSTTAVVVEANATVTISKVLTLTPMAYSSLPTGSEGMIAAITDSNTATWGATIAGSGSNNVIGFYNGSNWTVMGA